MSQKLLYHFGVHPRYKQDGSCTMSQIMKPHSWQASIFQQLTKKAKDGIRPQKTAMSIREDNTPFVPLLTSLQAYFLLVHTMLFSCLYSNIRNHNYPTTRL